MEGVCVPCYVESKANLWLVLANIQDGLPDIYGPFLSHRDARKWAEDEFGDLSGNWMIVCPQKPPISIKG